MFKLNCQKYTSKMYEPSNLIAAAENKAYLSIYRNVEYAVIIIF